MRKLFEQAHPDAAPLEVVGNRERDLRGGRVPEARVRRQGDDSFPLFGVERPDQRAAIAPSQT